MGHVQKKTLNISILSTFARCASVHLCMGHLSERGFWECQFWVGEVRVSWHYFLFYNSSVIGVFFIYNIIEISID